MSAGKLSVIVASYNSAATLGKCLEALAPQLEAGDEVIVADCSTKDPRLSFHRSFEAVKFLRFEDRLTIPELRREALKIASGEIVLLTEGRMVPSNGWAAAIRAEHDLYPQAPAVGGPIDSEPASAFDAAVFLCEYGRHMPPIGDGECKGPADAGLSGANLSYKRWALALCRDLVDAGAWEPFLNQRLAQQGHPLRRAGKAVVYYYNSLTVSQFFRQRFHYGRWFAVARVEQENAHQQGPLRRFVYALFCPLLPFLLSWRLGRVAFERRHLRLWFVRALGWILLFQAAWSFGELCGYLAGKGTSNREVF